MTDAPHRLTQAWRTLDFKPAQPGWRVVYLNRNERLVLPVAGWLVQESYHWDTVRHKAQDDDEPGRRVIPGVCVAADGWIVEPIDVDEPLVWMVLAPGEPEPTNDEQVAEQARRREESWRQRHSLQGFSNP